MYRHLLIKTLTLIFGALTVFYLIESVFNIFYFYPYLFQSNNAYQFTLSVQQGLFNKVVISYFYLLVYSFISITLITTPKEEVKNIHLLTSLLILVLSITFFKQTFESNFFIFLSRFFIK